MSPTARKGCVDVSSGLNPDCGFSLPNRTVSELNSCLVFRIFATGRSDRNIANNDGHNVWRSAEVANCMMTAIVNVTDYWSQAMRTAYQFKMNSIAPLDRRHKPRSPRLATDQIDWTNKRHLSGTVNASHRWRHRHSLIDFVIAKTTLFYGIISRLASDYRLWQTVIMSVRATLAYFWVN